MSSLIGKILHLINPYSCEYINLSEGRQPYIVDDNNDINNDKKDK